MNELSKLFIDITDNSVINLENRVYHVYQDDSFELTGYFCSNTAKKHENPDGLRRCAIFLKENKNIVINGNGASILIHGKMTPILLDRCENITIKNLEIDYACPTMTEFKILSNDNGLCTIRINEDCRYKIEGNEILWCGENDKNGVPYWIDACNKQGRYVKLYNPETKHTVDFNRNNLTFEKVREIEKNLLEVELQNKDCNFNVGSVIQTRSIVRDQTGGLFERCKNITFENLRVKFMHGLGMVSQFCENITYKNCDFTPSEHRTITSTADFFQFSGCKGKIIIDSCKASGAHDDFINVHGTHLRIVEANTEENSLVVRFMHNESWGFQAFDVGDIVDFIKWDTLQPFYSAKVIDFSKINDTDIKLKLNKALPIFEMNKDVLENATYTPDLHVKNCNFGATSGRGILCTTRGEVIIEGNHFENLWGPALLIEDDCNFWFESGYTTSITFKNNVVSNCDFGETSDGAPVIRYSPKVMDENTKTFVHGKLLIENNVFLNPTCNSHSFLLQHLREAEIKENTFDCSFDLRTFNVGTVTENNNIIK